MEQPQAAGEEIPLTLKVMRLCQPTFAHIKPQISTPGDLIDETVTQNALLATDSVFDGFPLSPSFVLPQVFGNIYLGEKFSCFVNLSNHTTLDVRTISVKAELQTPQQLVTLMDKNDVGSIGLGESRDFVLSHALDSDGTHMLLIVAIYVSQTGEQKSLRKYFKFSVLNALQVTARPVPVHGSVFVETQIKNLTQTPIFLESVIFNPAIPTTVDPIVPPNLNPFALPIDVMNLDSSLVSPGDVVKRVHRVLLPPTIAKVQELGRIEVFWKNSSGLSGHSVYPPVPLVDGSGEDITVRVLVKPSYAVQGRPFDFVFRVFNGSTQKVMLQLHHAFDVFDGLVPEGTSGQTLPEVAPACYADVTVSIVPVKTGFQTVKGLRIVNIFTKAVYLMDSIATVFVEPIPDSA